MLFGISDDIVGAEIDNNDVGHIGRKIPFTAGVCGGRVFRIQLGDNVRPHVGRIAAYARAAHGKNIVTVDLSQTSGAICQYMVICEGNTPTQVSALSDSVWDFARKNANEKPLSIDGTQGAQWIGMDYGTVLVHIFLPEQRAFYNLENLWADSKVIQVPNID